MNRTEDERRDAIVAAAERRDAVLKVKQNVYRGDVDYEAVVAELKAANGELDKACGPIEPPCKSLLSDSDLQKLWIAKGGGPAGDWSWERNVGAATMEAQADELDIMGFRTTAGILRAKAKKERGI